MDIEELERRMTDMEFEIRDLIFERWKNIDKQEEGLVIFQEDEEDDFYSYLTVTISDDEENPQVALYINNTVKTCESVRPDVSSATILLNEDETKKVIQALKEALKKLKNRKKA